MPERTQRELEQGTKNGIRSNKVDLIKFLSIKEEKEEGNNEMKPMTGNLLSLTLWLIAPANDR